MKFWRVPLSKLCIQAPQKALILTMLAASVIQHLQHQSHWSFFNQHDLALTFQSTDAFSIIKYSDSDIFLQFFAYVLHLGSVRP